MSLTARHARAIFDQVIEGIQTLVDEEAVPAPLAVELRAVAAELQHERPATATHLVAKAEQEVAEVAVFYPELTGRLTGIAADLAAAHTELRERGI